ncbi:NADH dehydrogenase [ubiquinone] 1 subunit C2 [Brachionichthys hirsutus]|uniref:NADH dehydrogenase [ubiquinone] 1 subunit C2 n=1 Tax=Brachionichthys hirsutus TaxID=412623 RepID=UPI003604C896
MGLIPDEGKALPPPRIVNKNSLWLSFVGWCSAMLHNGINQRPLLKAGVHRQVFAATIGWFIGYHASKYENYKYAKNDREMYEYVRLHPKEFSEKEKKTFAEIVEPFHPVR